METQYPEQLEVSSERPSLEYEPGSFTLTEILDSYLLPMVVQLDNQKHPLPFTEFNFDLSQPLLLFKKRNIQKVPAISVNIEGDQYVDVGGSLLIPEDYKGILCCLFFILFILCFIIVFPLFSFFVLFYKP